MRKLIDLKGKKFNRLTVIERYHENNIHNKPLWLCKCDCGKETIVNGLSLKNGNTKSCGCYAKEIQKLSSNKKSKHNLRNTRLYNIWRGMKKRCYDLKNKDYKNYGKRGIKICEEWLNDFKTFYDWAMSNGYKDNLTIDRIDTNGNYEPNNCRWTDLETQQNNRRNTEHITIGNDSKTMSQWARTIGVHHSSISNKKTTELKKEYILKKLNELK